MTLLRRYKDAYASMTVAVYEPLILEWKSKSLVQAITIAAANTAHSATANLRSASRPPNSQPTVARSLKQQTSSEAQPGLPAGGPVLLQGGAALTPRLIEKVRIDDLPHAERIGDEVFPFGLLRAEAGTRDLKTVESLDGRGPMLGPSVLTAPELAGRRFAITSIAEMAQFSKEFSQLLDTMAVQPASEARKVAIEFSKKYFGANGRDRFMIPVEEVEFIRELLSPIGIAHFYRQLYFNLEEGVGPIEEAFTIAPLETLDVFYEDVRRQTHEEVLELGAEETTESNLESHNLEEVSDKVASMLQRDIAAGIQTRASYSTPVFQVGVSAGVDLASSSARSSEETSRRLKETTKQASERITKTFSLRTRTTGEFTSTATTHRTIENKNASPVSYGLRRVLRRVRVKVQDVGPRLVWQYYVANPGAGLALSRFVHFAAEQGISVPDVPPGLPPKPAGGKDSGTAICSVRLKRTAVTNESNPEPGQYGPGVITLRIPAGKERLVTSVTIDSITDVGDPNPDQDRGEPAPTSYGALQLNTDGTYQLDIDLRSGDSWTVNVGYTYTYDPSSLALTEWEALRAQAVTDLKNVANKDAFNKAFDQQRALITARSRIQPRPAADLRREEREEVMNRIVTEIFGSTTNRPVQPTPLEIETVNRLFDLEGAFTYLHPSWWRPRFTLRGGVFRPANYEISSDSDPAPLGSSLGWKLQLDGDRRRNAFLNSPWCRVCIPIRPGRERQALKWLAAHVEDDTGFSIAGNSPLGKMLKDVEARRAQETALGVNGPEYIEVGEGQPGPGPLRPEDIYPVVDTFDVTVPTDGFVYDEITIDAS